MIYLNKTKLIMNLYLAIRVSTYLTFLGISITFRAIFFGFPWCGLRRNVFESSDIFGRNRSCLSFCVGGQRPFGFSISETIKQIM